MTEKEIENIKAQCERSKFFNVIEVIEYLQKENKRLNQTEWEDADTIAHMASTIAELEKENSKLVDKLNLQNQRLNELKKEIEQLKTCQTNTEGENNASTKLNEIKNYLGYEIPHELINEATNKIWRML